ncbi:MAG: beta-lactamase family protein [Cyclobacteriaceae bacterium]|nr:beta-lactamase family protein [Cyclobacteriaceae bacterium]
MKTTLFIVLLFSFGLTAFVTSRSIPMTSIKQYLQEQVNGGKSPSLQYIFFDTDSIIYEFHSGVKNVRTNTAVDSSTRYHVYSVTKTFTALAVLQLAQDGKLALDKPAADYLPGFPYPKQITVEQLLSHTSGIPNPLPLRWIHRVEEHKGFNRDEFFAEVFRKHSTLDFEPGTKFKYSNLGYVLLGQLIEKVSGQSFEDYVETNIVDRSGVDRRELNFTLDTSVHAVGYQKWFSFYNAIFTFLIDKATFMGEREGGWKPFKPFYNNGVAYGGLFGTGPSLVKYAQALLKANSVLLNDSYKEILFREGVVNGQPTGMAHSWFTGVLKGNRYFAHAGGGGGYYVELRVYPNLGVGSVILFNRTGVSDERILDNIDKAFIAEREHAVAIR